MNAAPVRIIACCLAGLSSAVTAQEPPAELKMLDVTFHVSVVRTGGKDSLKLETTGVAGETGPRLIPIEGKLAFSQAADLNNDGLPEIYLAIAPDDPKKMSRLIAFVADKQKGLMPISFAPKGDDGQFEFNGGDRFTIGKGVLLHRLPLHRPSDEIGKPSVRSVHTYQLSGTETGGWALVGTHSKMKMRPVRKRAR